MPINKGYLTARTDKASDEVYTPAYAVRPIVKYVDMFRRPSIVWCPFDTEESEYVKLIREAGHKVIASHIANGQDFMSWEPEEHWDCIISNPPFGGKRQTFERALSFDRPFALLMALTWLNDSAPKQLFMEKDLQLLMFDKRIKFLNNGVVQNKITFSSAYYCWNFLPKQIIMEKLNESNK